MREFTPVHGDYLPDKSPNEVMSFVQSPEQEMEDRLDAAAELAQYFGTSYAIRVPTDFETSHPAVQEIVDVDGWKVALVGPKPPKDSNQD